MVNGVGVSDSMNDEISIMMIVVVIKMKLILKLRSGRLSRPIVRF